MVGGGGDACITETLDEPVGKHSILLSVSQITAFNLLHAPFPDGGFSNVNEMEVEPEVGAQGPSSAAGVLMSGAHSTANRWRAAQCLCETQLCTFKSLLFHDGNKYFY